MRETANYDLKSIKLPRLTGGQLSFAANAVENPVLKAALMPSMLKTGGIDVFRSLAPEEFPTVFPIMFVDKPAIPVDNPDLKALDKIEAGKGASIPYKTTRDYAKAYHDGKTSPEDVAKRALDAIKQADSGDLKLRPFIAVNEGEVMNQARASAERWKNKRPLSVLDGVPVAVKDEVDMVPYPTTWGTRFVGKAPAKQDATIVARLRAAGALLLGKANMHEIGINPDGLNVNYGSTRNPFNPKYDTGGSSSGPATAVSAGICPFAVGADGGGSIRIPSALCGIVGLKPTFGRLSEFGAAPLCWSVAHVGPLAATVEDTAISYACMAGPDVKEPNSLHQPAVTLDGWNKTDLKGVTLGVYKPWFEHASPDVVKVCLELLEKLAGTGAQIKEIVIPGLDTMRIAHVICILGEMAASMSNYPANMRDFGAEVRVSLGLGREFTATDYLKAQRLRTRAINVFKAIYKEVDAIITPATGIAAPEVSIKDAAGGWSDLSSTTEVMRFAFPGNLAGLPAISFPAGYNSLGLPIGMQAMGRWWEENVLLRIAYTAEQLVERKKPAILFELI
ncbi:MAG: amidase [Dehalococcoidia bacterium]|jgi:Asp-tRNA(Asn)/Glu-tRNA(Gln) amidotransferase A subunit family amidase